MTIETSNRQNITILVGSTNPVKSAAAKEGVLTLHPGANVTVIPIEANHGITDWKSPHAIGQPFGLEQTKRGAVNRMQECWNQANTYLNDQLSHLYVVGFENGLLQGEEIYQDPTTWYDTCLVAVREMLSNSEMVIKQGEAIPTEFGSPTENDQSELTFDDQVLRYHKLILPKLKNKEDLYIEWTKDFIDGPYARSHYLTACFISSINQLHLIQQAKNIVDGCAKEGIVASLGTRYKNMHWMRDLAYMTPVYLKRGHETAVLNALKALCQSQCCEHKPHNNGYEVFNTFGKMPIVCVFNEKERDFLLQRLRGTAEDPFWQIQLWEYCKRNRPDTLCQFPVPLNSDHSPNNTEPPSLTNCQSKDLRDYYERLLEFREQLLKATEKVNKTPPGPSFALRCFMEGKLCDITPGTRDSEIHFMRALLCLESHKNQQGQHILTDFAEPLAGALFYLYMNVLDPKDGLPRGCDSRDIFADLLYDAKTLSNAVFWYETLKAFLTHAETLEKTPIRDYLIKAIKNHQGACQETSPEIPKVLLEMANFNSFSHFFSEQVQNLKASIENKLLFKNGEFFPRDFIPGPLTKLHLAHPVNGSPALAIIHEHHRDFITGENVDPQSLAHTVLNGLIPNKYYNDVINLFRSQDSPIGVTVFVPISGKTEKESELLRHVKGQVVWPHVSWAVVRALKTIGTPHALDMAAKQREKLINLGCGEWYAANPTTGRPIQGGDPQQGWAASGILESVLN